MNEKYQYELHLRANNPQKNLNVIGKMYSNLIKRVLHADEESQRMIDEQMILLENLSTALLSMKHHSQQRNLGEIN